jgi:hypothetical protein
MRAKCLKIMEAWVGIEPAYTALQAVRRVAKQRLEPLPPERGRCRAIRRSPMAPLYTTRSACTESAGETAGGRLPGMTAPAKLTFTTAQLFAMDLAADTRHARHVYAATRLGTLDQQIQGLRSLFHDVMLRGDRTIELLASLDAARGTIERIEREVRDLAAARAYLAEHEPDAMGDRPRRR